MYVANGVHVVKESVVWGIVGREVGMDVAVVEILGTHIIYVIAGLKSAPIVDEFWVAGIHYAVGEFVDRAHGFVLH